MNINELIKEAERELHMRERVYPKWVELGKLNGATADRQLARQREIVEVLDATRNMLTATDRTDRKAWYDRLMDYKPKPPAQEQQALFDEPKRSIYDEG